MIKLNADESMLLLIVKGWEHKEVPLLPEDRRMLGNSIKYVEKVCKHRCFGDANSEHRVDLFTIYANLAEKLLTVRQLVRIMEYFEPSRHSYTLTPIEGLISELRLVHCADGDTKLIEFDYTHVQRSIPLCKGVRNEKTVRLY